MSHQAAHANSHAIQLLAIDAFLELARVGRDTSQIAAILSCASALGERTSLPSRSVTAADLDPVLMVLQGRVPAQPKA